MILGGKKFPTKIVEKEKSFIIEYTFNQIVMCTTGNLLREWTDRRNVAFSIILKMWDIVYIFSSLQLDNTIYHSLT